MEWMATGPLQANGKLKVGSSILANLGAGLFASGFGRWFFDGFDGWAAVWTIFGLAGMAIAIQAMSFLEAETVHG
jgi:hypothetical protein